MTKKRDCLKMEWILRLVSLVMVILGTFILFSFHSLGPRIIPTLLPETVDQVLFYIGNGDGEGRALHGMFDNNNNNNDDDDDDKDAKHDSNA